MIFNESIKEYIGDGVYVTIAPNYNEITLTTENGISVTNTIVMELEMLVVFIRLISNTPVLSDTIRKALGSAK